jgi:uncharacterized membrane protein
MTDRRTLSAALLLTLVFVVGALSGMLVERVMDRPAASPAFGGRPGPGGAPGKPAQGSARFAERLGQRLQLTEEQESEIAVMLSESQAEVANLLSTVKPEIIVRIDSLIAGIRLVLDAEQRAAFEQMLSEDNDRFRRRMEDGLTGVIPTDRRNR